MQTSRRIRLLREITYLKSTLCVCANGIPHVEFAQGREPYCLYPIPAMFGVNIKICLFESIHKYSTILSFCSKGNQMAKEMFTTLLWIKSVEEVQILKLPRLNMKTDYTLVQLSMLVILYRFISSNQNWSSRNLCRYLFVCFFYYEGVHVKKKKKTEQKRFT